MKKLFRLIFLLILVQTAWAGKTLHLRSSSFTFSVTEPEGWAIDFRSAAQVANFVMHRRGTTWRHADVIVLARFNRMPGNDSLQTVVEMESQEFQEFQRKCPLSEVQDVNWEIDGSHDFLVKTVYCTGVRHEIVAFTKVPGFFITFILSVAIDSQQFPAEQISQTCLTLLCAYLVMHLAEALLLSRYGLEVMVMGFTRRVETSTSRTLELLAHFIILVGSVVVPMGM